MQKSSRSHGALYNDVNKGESEMVIGSWYTVDGKHIKGLSELQFPNMDKARSQIEATYECILLEESERLGWILLQVKALVPIKDGTKQRKSTLRLLLSH
ncbi:MULTISPECIES: hypothetical protein [unclassified Vibrio]|uniref:hypothetical protein n=1 Tax=unclassified Vibrio TaxID=2614977 RepID=UPI0010566E97|nr:MULTISPECIES: hypothetical protein [unclassified Vibrio]